MTDKGAHATCLGTVLLAAFVPAAGGMHALLLDWDEARYVRAARLGLRANAMDEGSLDAGEFIAFVRSRIENRRRDLPPGYDEASDPFLLRNLHPPLAVYCLAPFSGSRDERWVRAGLRLAAVALVALLFWGYATASPRRTFVGTAVVGALALWAARHGFISIHTHGWMSIWLLAATTSLVQWLYSRQPRWGLLTCGFLAAALATLHTGLVATAALAVATLLVVAQDRRWGRTPRGVGRPIALGLTAVAVGTVVLWPSGLLKLGYAKIAAYYTYLLLQGVEWSSAGDTRAINFAVLLPVVGFIPVVAVWLVRSHAGRAASWAPAMAVCLSYAIPVVPNLVAPHYLLPALVPMIPLIGWYVDDRRLRWHRHLALAAVVVLVGASFAWRTPYARAHDPASDVVLRQDLAWLRSHVSGREVLADFGDVFRHYLGPETPVRSINVGHSGIELFIRENGRYRPLMPEDTSGHVVVVMAHRRRLHALHARQAVLAGCRAHRRKSFTAYDCGGG